LCQASASSRDAFAKEVLALSQPSAPMVCNWRDAASALVQASFRSFSAALPALCPWSLLPRQRFASACPEGCVDPHGQHPGRVWLCISLSYSRLCSLPQLRPLKTGFARSKAKAMDPEIARNQNYDDYYANDSEDVHSALLPFHDDSAWRARSPYVATASKLNASFRHRCGSVRRRLASTSHFYRHRLYPQ
jgi:hypothetical protein